MRTPERRKTARTTPEGLVYISFEPDNGGIVLNVSEGGLGFNAVATVQQTGKIRVWFSADSHKIEAECEVVWTDETQRTGGLRFNDLSPAAREQIRNWSKPAGAAAQVDRTLPAPRAFPVIGALRADSSAVPEDSPQIEVRTPEAKGFGRLGPFSRGLATGVLLSTLVGGAFLFHAYRRQFGEALIRLGEHFSGKPQPQASSPASGPISAPPVTTRPRPQTAQLTPAPAAGPPQDTKPERQAATPPSPVVGPVPAMQPTPPLQAASPASTAIPVLVYDKQPSPPVTEAVKSQTSGLESAPPGNAVSAAVPAASPLTTPATSHSTASNPSELGQPGSAPTGDIHVEQLASGSQSKSNPEYFAELGAGIPLGKYFEIGKFKDEPEANQTANRLAQTGFHAVVVQKSRLWSDSYHVLAGPYGEGREAETARGKLKSSGFKPRTLARKSRRLQLLSSRSGFDGLFVRYLPIGDVVVSWVPYSPEATVKFVKDGVAVTTVQGKWVNRDASYQHDAIVYRMSDHGSRTLLEIQFSGAKQALVLADNNRKIIF